MSCSQATASKVQSEEGLFALCLNLAKCESEDELIVLLKSYGYWDNPEAWLHYGDNENNYSAIGNQQSRPEAALVEKIINSVDSMLTSNCLKSGIDPESPSAPRDIVEATARFLGIPEGKLTHLSQSDRTRLAQNIMLVATGSKSAPNYTIIDKGEGQSAETLPQTILSLGKSNKLRIPFVQGKFNMGGSGVLQFCGNHGLQLVITRRNPELVSSADEDETADDWAFTIVRRFYPESGVRSSTYKYLAPGGRIMHFKRESLPLLPGRYPETHGEEFYYGAYIKLFQYEMPGGLKTNILFDLYNKLSLLLPEIAVPVRLLERRVGYTGHSMETTLSGLTVRLSEDRKDNLEENFPCSSTLSVEGQEMDVAVYAFKKDKISKYTDKDGIIFTINGQTHAAVSKSFFTRKSVDMGYIKDSLLVVVDCSKISGGFRENLFMTSRDRLRSGTFLKAIEGEMEQLLGNHPGLKALRARRREEAIKDKLGDSKPLAEMLSKILRKSPSLARLFGLGQRLTNPLKARPASSQDQFDGQRYPSFFTLLKNFPAGSPKHCPSNQRFRVQFKTDAENDYFSRSQDRGKISLKVNGLVVSPNTACSGNLWNGRYNLNLRLPQGAKAGQCFHYQVEVEDISRTEPFRSEFFIQVELPVTKKQGATSARKKPSGDREGDDNESSEALGLPQVTPVEREDWHLHGFDEKSALKIVQNGEGGYDFFLNKDNAHLLTEQKYNRRLDPKIQYTRYEAGMVLIALAILKEQRSKKNQDAEREPDEASLVLSVTRAVSPVLLTLIESLGELTID
ncbi:hypothetical protein N8546_01400 [bacterium]|nr:hypothetical protein [bacterium]